MPFFVPFTMLHCLLTNISVSDALLKVGRIGAKAGAGIHLAGVYLIAFSVACGRAVFSGVFSCMRA